MLFQGVRDLLTIQVGKLQFDDDKRRLVLVETLRTRDAGLADDAAATAQTASTR
jgi:hypothetical protein